MRRDGQKHFLAIEDGTRESTQSWREVLLHLKQKGVSAPQLGIGDGALGFWAALDEIYPETRHQRCWVHKTANILNHMPKSLQPKAKSDLQEIWMSETKENAETAEKNWRKIKGFQQLGKILTGIKFKNGIEVKIEKNKKAA